VGTAYCVGPVWSWEDLEAEASSLESICMFLIPLHGNGLRSFLCLVHTSAFPPIIFEGRLRASAPKRDESMNRAAEPLVLVPFAPD
jgi:hypothetical protein